MKCKCVEKLNDSPLMKENNSFIPTATMINFKTGACRQVINLPLERAKSTLPRPKTKFITANYCPFCGLKQDNT